MSRILLYLSAYLTTLVIYIFLNQQSGYDSFVVIAFIIATLAYTFSRDEIPNNEVLYYPEAAKYRSNRFNTYGYGMLALLIFSSILIAINSYIYFINQAILILLIWPLAVCGSYVLAKVNQSRESIYPAYDYTCKLLNRKVDFDLFKWIIYNVNDNKNFDKLPHRFRHYDLATLRETCAAIQSYFVSSTNLINSNEVNASNQKDIE